MPRPKAEQSAKTVPDDDFFALLMRAQAGRMEDQRATVGYFFDISTTSNSAIYICLSPCFVHYLLL